MPLPNPDVYLPEPAPSAYSSLSVTRAASTAMTEL